MQALDEGRLLIILMATPLFFGKISKILINPVDILYRTWRSKKIFTIS